MVIYADMVFLANFISTFALILTYTYIFSCNRRLIRIALASALSGFYAVAEMAYGLVYILRVMPLILINFIAFGRSCVLYNTARFVFVTACMQAVFIALMLCFGNNAYIVNGTVTVFAGGISGGIVYFISYPILLAVKTFIKRRNQQRIADLIIKGQEIRLSLLYDSGNLLTYKGECVAVVAWETVNAVLPYASYEDFLMQAEDRMIFSTVGNGGIMPIIKPDKSIIDGKNVDIKIAVANRIFKNYDGIIGI